MGKAWQVGFTLLGPPPLSHAFPLFISKARDDDDDDDDVSVLPHVDLTRKTTQALTFPAVLGYLIIVVSSQLKKVETKKP